MTFKVFTRKCWKPNPEWPNGYEPTTKPIDKCPTVMLFNTFSEAISYCDQRNKHWRKHRQKVYGGTATPAQIRTYYSAKRYEWTEV